MELVVTAQEVAEFAPEAPAVTATQIEEARDWAEPLLETAGVTLLWTDEGELSGSRTGVCRLVDERAYPLTATIGTVGFRLRIQARDAAALSVDGEGLSGNANDSHLGHLPPGVHLQPGEVITTAEGDRYQVVPPVQRDALGDTVGLSWQGQGSGHAPLPEPASGDPTPDVPPAPDAPAPGRDPWWDEGLP